MIRRRAFIAAVMVGCFLFATGALAQKLERAVLAFGSTGPNLTPFWVGRDAGL